MLLSEPQARAILDAGFTHGTRGYPVLFSDSGRITIVEEGLTRLVVWEFEQDGSMQSRSYNKEG